MAGNFWKDKIVLITGGYGFLGQQVVHMLQERGLTEDRLVLFHKADFDLRKGEDVKRLLALNKNINIVIHLAGDIGGIGYNRKFPGSVFYNNIMMNTLVMEYSRLSQVKKFVGVGTVCAYPKFAHVPFREEKLWDGYPEETNASYGLAKKMMLVQGQAYKEQFGFNAVHLLMINLYGPGDNFDLENSHVIAGLIRKFVEAKREGRQEVVVWGTGNASREFLYVEDAAEAIMLATEEYNKPEPVNIGVGFEIKIKDLVDLIVKLTGFKGKIVWDTTKPDGQPRRMLDTTRAQKEFGFEAKTPFEEGLRKTIQWYMANKEKASA
ncbi:MAG: GDP-L-fucose synthase [Candidatus Marinimicrobia bacterium]|nr:GDP-L-fucose synthase [candidate division WOR-3 bacterium]MCK4445852.1 GDP-L-fucose synthase [Candidatus Neomarinimicrobiota bacterium]